MVCKIRHSLNVAEWENHSTVPTFVHVRECGIMHDIFCYPPYNEERNQIECKTLDSSHILNNIRSHISRGGYTGISKQAFIAVSDHDHTVLPKAIIVDQLDKQNVAISVRFFSKEVEDIMSLKGYLFESRFVQLVRNWYEATDERGVDAFTRLQHLQDMFDYLSTRMPYDDYPPPTKYVHGMPVTTFEAIMHTISTRFILFDLAAKKTYNPRAIGTLGIESFFGDLTRMEFSGMGCLKSCDIPKLISHIVELNAVKHDPER